MPKKIEKVEDKIETSTEKTQKEKLLDLYQELQNLGIRSISDLENMISNS